MSKTRDEIAAAYDSPPWWYDVRGFFILTFAYNSTLGRQLRFFGVNVGSRHLELGCGTGTLLGMVLKWRKYKRLPEAKITGLDYAEPMLAGAAKRFAKSQNINLILADAAQLPFEDSTFDTINVANAIHCFPDVDCVIKETYRVLKTGGTLAANVLLFPRTPWPFRQIAQKLDDWGMRKGILYTPYHLQDIKTRFQNAGFEIISESISGNCYFVLCKKP